MQLTLNLQVPNQNGSPEPLDPMVEPPASDTASNVIPLTRGTKMTAQTKSRLVVGQRIHSILYGGRNGTIYAIHGEQKPETVGTMCGVISHGGNAEFDIVFDNGTMSSRLPECILRGVQWRIYDEIYTAEQITGALKYAADLKAKREKAEADSKVRFAKECERLKAAYPHLTPLGEDNRWSVTAAASNLRKQLKHDFPGVKFSVRSKSYTGGDSITVEWTDGPDVASVKAIGDKFEQGHFDGMTDSYEYSKSPWTETFGGTKYVFTDRTKSPVIETPVEVAEPSVEAPAIEQATETPACAHKRIKLVTGQGCTCRDCGAKV